MLPTSPSSAPEQETGLPDELVRRSRASLRRVARARGEIARDTTIEARALVRAVSDLNTLVATTMAECGVLAQAHPSATVREAAEQVLLEATDELSLTQQCRPIYDALGAIASRLGDPQRRVVSLQRRDMRRAGVELDRDGRERLRALQQELVGLGHEFTRNIRDDVPTLDVAASDLDLLPLQYRRRHPSNPDGSVSISVASADLGPFMSLCPSDLARQQLMRLATTRARRNLSVLDRILGRRHELARLLGYPSYAAYVTETETLCTPARVRAFIAQAFEASRPLAEREREALLRNKPGGHAAGSGVREHELSYLSAQLRQQLLDLDPNETTAYFPYREVRRWMLELVGQLFELTFEAVELRLWHPSVQTYRVLAGEKLLGLVSLDLLQREGKPAHPRATTYRPGVGGKQLPHMVLFCSFPDRDLGEAPLLLEHAEVVTILHEFGHVIHGILRGQLGWLELTDPIESDFMEVPSKVLEEWAYDPAVLRSHAKHFETGASISDRVIDGLRRGRLLGRGLQVQRQLFLAAVALELHELPPAELDTTAVCQALAAKYSPTLLDPASLPHASFVHLENYGPMYVSYVWSLALAREVLGEFRSGLLHGPTLRRYRDDLLATGGTAPAAELVARFLGRPHTYDAFYAWLLPQPDVLANE